LSPVHFEAIVQSSEDAILTKDRNAVITSWNPAAAALYGYSAEEAIGQPVSILIPEHRAGEERDILEHAMSGARVEHYETERVRKDGRRIQVSLTISPIRDADGKVARAGVVARDVSERIRAQRERERMAMELERSNEELEQFAYVASHDLNEPLRVISGFVQLLQRRYEGRLDEQADRFIGAAVDGIERMQAMIDALLEYSRVGRVGVGSKEVDCDRAVQHARLSLDRLIHERDAELHVGTLPKITGEPVLIDQLFQNLISNAVKYGSPEHPRVDVSAEQVNGNWRFSVEDNGGGVDPRHAERVFEMFKRLHGRDEAGTGIGLAICRRIVEKHGGEIWVESRDDGGSAFRFTLPAGRREA
jgi:PAS domain S-box-containing protein